MNAIDLLKGDHDRIKALFRDYSDAGSHLERKRSIVGQLFMELTVHHQLEEEIFYPAVSEQVATTGPELVRESLSEHGLLMNLVDELKALPPEHELYDLKLQALGENLRHHMDDEEDEMFVQAGKQFGMQMDDLGVALKQRRAVLADMEGPFTPATYASVEG